MPWAIGQNIHAIMLVLQISDFGAYRQETTRADPALNLSSCKRFLLGYHTHISAIVWWNTMAYPPIQAIFLYWGFLANCKSILAAGDHFYLELMVLIVEILQIYIQRT